MVIVNAIISKKVTTVVTQSVHNLTRYSEILEKGVLVRVPKKAPNKSWNFIALQFRFLLRKLIWSSHAIKIHTRDSYTENSPLAMIENNQRDSS